jgi:hypothetical protein
VKLERLALFLISKAIRPMDHPERGSSVSARWEMDAGLTPLSNRIEGPPKQPMMALLIRAVVMIVPILASVSVGLAVHRLLHVARSDDVQLAWILVQLASAIVTLLVVERVMRILLPLATLLFA